MKVINLIENEAGACEGTHGLSFYIETANHKVLIDAGPSGALLLANAQKKGVDLSQVDTAFLTHGHYDHGDGFAAFASVNEKAGIYLQEGCDGDFYSIHEDGEPHYIGLSEEVKKLPALSYISGDLQIDEELSVFTCRPQDHMTVLPPPGNNIGSRNL